MHMYSLSKAAVGECCVNDSGRQFEVYIFTR